MARRRTWWILTVGALVVGGALICLLFLVGMRDHAVDPLAGVDADSQARRLRSLEARERPALSDPDLVQPRDVAAHPEAPGGVRAWSAESVELAVARAGEEAPVHAHRLDTYDPATPGAAPNPFIPPKKHRSYEDTRAGLDITQVTP
jgi:hypothetical protein